MKNKSYLIILILLSSFSIYAQDKITFASEDGLQISADLYKNDKPNSPIILLFHQARWSRGEYVETAPRLNSLGFHCLAVDLRSGDKVNDVDNETTRRASEANKGTTYIDAIPDIRAAIKYAKSKFPNSTLIIWGSSYSSSLVLKVASAMKTDVAGVLSFSPGEYFERLGKSKTFIRAAARAITQPVFITSAKNEFSNWQAIYKAIPSDKKAYFIPKTKGQHGSRALWSKFADSSAYWVEVKKFLSQFL